MTLHFRGQRRASSLYYRNRPEITVLVCAKKSAFPCMVIELSEVGVSDGHNYFPVISLGNLDWFFYFPLKFLKQYTLAPEVRSRNS